MDPHLPAPGPYGWESVASAHGSVDGNVFIVDAAGRKIAAVWCKTGERGATAELFSIAPQLFSLARELAPDRLARLIGPESPLRTPPPPIARIRETLRS